MSLAAGTQQPASDLDLGHWGNFSRLAWCRDWILGELKAGSAEVPSAEGADPECGRVGVCMSVDLERHTLTHTHSHARTHSGPSAAPPTSPGPPPPLPDLPGPAPAAKSIAKAFSLTQRAGFGGQKGERWGVAPPPRCPRPPGEGNAERVPGALTAQAAECGRERPAGPAPPRRQGRRGRGWRAGPEGTRG